MCADTNGNRRGVNTPDGALDGDTMFNDAATPLTPLATRRSSKPRDLVAPGPDGDQLHAMIEIADRTPDHDKLAPCRFVIVPSGQRHRLAEVITSAYRAGRP
jgi:hypothetical protein